MGGELTSNTRTQMMLEEIKQGKNTRVAYWIRPVANHMLMGNPAAGPKLKSTLPSCCFQKLVLPETTCLWGQVEGHRYLWAGWDYNWCRQSRAQLGGRVRIALWAAFQTNENSLFCETGSVCIPSINSLQHTVLADLIGLQILTCHFNELHC